MLVKIKTNISNQLAFINAKKIDAVLYEPSTNQWDSKILLFGGESVVAACAPDQLIAALGRERDGVVDLTQNSQ